MWGGEAGCEFGLTHGPRASPGGSVTEVTQIRGCYSGYALLLPSRHHHSLLPACGYGPFPPDRAGDFWKHPPMRLTVNYHGGYLFLRGNEPLILQDGKLQGVSLVSLGRVAGGDIIIIPITEGIHLTMATC